MRYNHSVTRPHTHAGKDGAPSIPMRSAVSLGLEQKSGPRISNTSPILPRGETSTAGNGPFQASSFRGFLKSAPCFGPLVIVYSLLNLWFKVQIIPRSSLWGWKLISARNPIRKDLLFCCSLSPKHLTVYELKPEKCIANHAIRLS